MSLFSSLHIAGSGLAAQTRAVQISGNNVANSATPGYSTRVVELSATGSERVLGVTLGMTVRKNDPFLRATAQQAQARLGFEQGKSEALQRAESVLARVEGDQLLSALQGFFSAADDLAQNPSSMAVRRTFLAQAGSVSNAFVARSATIKGLVTDTNKRLAAAADQASSLASQLASLNKSIASGTSTGDGNAGLMDQRDQVAGQLLALVGGQAVTDERGRINIMAFGSAIVAGEHSLSLSMQPNATTGQMDIVATGYGSETAVVTARATTGEMGGLIAARDGELAQQAANADALAFDFMNAANAIHQSGYGLDGATGRALFAGPTSVTDAASLLVVSSAVAGQPNAVAAASASGTLPGDNRQALLLAGLSSALSVSGGTESVLGAYQRSNASLVGTTELALATHTQASGQFELSSSMLEQAVGVSLDDQMVQLQQFQRSYQASAKVISVVNEMLETLVRL
jgi:flagellar hook-associated protein 1 FlgK